LQKCLLIAGNQVRQYDASFSRMALALGISIEPDRSSETHEIPGTPDSIIREDEYDDTQELADSWRGFGVRFNVRRPTERRRNGHAEGIDAPFRR
jgi:hypothetical protein